MNWQEYEHRIDIFGSQVRLLIGEPSVPDLLEPKAMAQQIEEFLKRCQQSLSRFDPKSELSLLNHSEQEDNSVSHLLLTMTQAALWAAEFSDGLVDPTLVREIVNAGYSESFVRDSSVSLLEAITDAPSRKPAKPNPDSSWSQIKIDRERGSIHKPVGVQLDSGGVGKGLAADLVAVKLANYRSFAIDMGGDIRVGGSDAPLREIQIEHPITKEIAYSFQVKRGAIATSGLGNRLWRSGNKINHHLLDPSTGQPAWTSLIQATALAPTATRAETLSKMALLLGPKAGSELLKENGGAVVYDSGELGQIGLSQTQQPVTKVAP